MAALAAPELALCALVVVGEAAELAEPEAEEADAEALDIDMDMDMLPDADDDAVTDPPPVIDMAPSPVNVPSAIDLVVTSAVFESELLYHGWLNASGIARMFHPFCRPIGKAAMKASTSVSLISCSKELIPGDLDPSNQPVMAAKTDSWV